MSKTLRSWEEGQKLIELCSRLLDHIRALNGEEGSKHDYDSVSDTEAFLEKLDDLRNV
jgi:hypothetical protein